MQNVRLGRRKSSSQTLQLAGAEGRCVEGSRIWVFRLEKAWIRGFIFQGCCSSSLFRYLKENANTSWKVLFQTSSFICCNCARDFNFDDLKLFNDNWNRLEHGVYNLSRLRESASNRFKSFHIPVDWMLDTGFVSQVNYLTVVNFCFAFYSYLCIDRYALISLSHLPTKPAFVPITC